MILLIDNYAPSTYNPGPTLGEIDPSLDLEVHRNDQITPEEIERRGPSALDHFARPLHPGRGGRLAGCVKRFSGRIPLLGVCLGHQAIGQALAGGLFAPDG